MIESISVTTEQYVKLNYELADIEQRIFAVIVDRILLLMIYGLGMWMSIYVKIDGNIMMLLYILVSIMNLFIEYLSHGQTLGKMLMRITVISDNGIPPSFSQCFVRWLLYPIDLWIVGIVMINVKSQRLGDMSSGCYVVKKQTNKMVKVSLEDDYKYAEPKYEPMFENALQLTQKDLKYINYALYDKNFYSQQDQVAVLVRKKLGLQKDNMSNRQFLQQVRNDYFYQLQVLEKEPAV